jgi:hypothetical protein
MVQYLSCAQLKEVQLHATCAKGGMETKFPASYLLLQLGCTDDRLHLSTGDLPLLVDLRTVDAEDLSITISAEIERTIQTDTVLITRR